MVHRTLVHTAHANQHRTLGIVVWVLVAAGLWTCRATRPHPAPPSSVGTSAPASTSAQVQGLAKRILDGARGASVILVGEDHGNATTTELEEVLIDLSVKKFGVRHIGLEAPEPMGKKLLEAFRASPTLDGKSGYKRALWRWFRAIEELNKKAPDKRAELFFFDLTKRPEHAARCEGGKPFCSELIRRTTRYFKDREAYMANVVLDLHARRKGRLLLITGASHVYRRPMLFGAPALFQQIERGEETPRLDWYGGIHFPGLRKADVAWREEPLGARLVARLGDKAVVSVVIDSRAGAGSLTTALRSSGKRPPIVVPTTDAAIADLKLQRPVEGLYSPISQDAPTRELFDFYVWLAR